MMAINYRLSILQDTLDTNIVDNPIDTLSKCAP